MARVTVEDCVEIIPNRFELVLCASQRAREIDLGSAPHLPRENDKNTVVALREIAEKHVHQIPLTESIVQRFQKNASVAESDLVEKGDEEDLLDASDESQMLLAMRRELGDDAFDGEARSLEVDFSAEDEDFDDEE